MYGLNSLQHNRSAHAQRVVREIFRRVPGRFGFLLSRAVAHTHSLSSCNEARLLGARCAHPLTRSLHTTLFFRPAPSQDRAISPCWQ